MKQNSITTVLSIAAIAVSVLGLLVDMNRVSEAGAVTLESRITTLEGKQAIDADHINRVDAKLSGRFQFMTESARRLDYLCARDRICGSRFQPMPIPE